MEINHWIKQLQKMCYMIHSISRKKICCESKTEIDHVYNIVFFPSSKTTVDIFGPRSFHHSNLGIFTCLNEWRWLQSYNYIATSTEKILQTSALSLQPPGKNSACQRPAETDAFPRGRSHALAGGHGRSLEEVWCPLWHQKDQMCVCKGSLSVTLSACVTLVWKVCWG